MVAAAVAVAVLVYNVDDNTWVLMADNGGVDGGGQQCEQRRWLGQQRTTVWSTTEGDDVVDNMGHVARGRMIGKGSKDQRPLAGNCIVVANSGRRAAEKRVRFFHFTALL